MKKILVVLVSLFAACAESSKNEDQSAQVAGFDLNVSVKSSAKEFALQLDGLPEVVATYAQDGTFAVMFSGVTAGTHVLECVNGDTKHLVTCEAVKINGFEKCIYDETKLRLRFAVPVTAADENCGGVEHWSFVNDRMSTWEEMIPPLEDQSVITAIENMYMFSAVVDLPCVEDAACKNVLLNLRLATGMIWRLYWNPYEMFQSESDYYRRETQKKIKDVFDRDYPDCFLLDSRTSSPTRLVTWVDNQGRYPMNAINVSRESPTYNGKTCTQLSSDMIIEVIKENEGILGGVEFDNGRAFIHYVPGYQLKSLADGRVLSPTETDLSHRNGLVDLYQYWRKAYPREGFLLTTRSNSNFFAPYVDGISFETFFDANLGVGPDEQAMMVAMQTKTMSEDAKFITLAHCKVGCVWWGEASQSRGFPSEFAGKSIDEQQRSYFFTLLFDNALAVNDTLGAQGHGHDQLNPLANPWRVMTGKVLENLELPYKETTPDFTKLQALGSGVPLVIHLSVSERLYFAFSVENDPKFSGTITFCGNTLSQEWISGYILVKEGIERDCQIVYNGPGRLVITHVTRMDMSQSETGKMFRRKYVDGTVYWNPSQTEVRYTPDGTPVGPTLGVWIKK